MIIVSSPYGPTLVFLDRQSLEATIEHLTGLLGRDELGRGLRPPFLYHQAEEHVPAEEVDQWTDWLKFVFGEGIDANHD